jgi:hypothetical protein
MVDDIITNQLDKLTGCNNDRIESLKEQLKNNINENLKDIALLNKETLQKKMQNFANLESNKCINDSRRGENSEKTTINRLNLLLNCFNVFSVISPNNYDYKNTQNNVFNDLIKTLNSSSFYTRRDTFAGIFGSNPYSAGKRKTHKRKHRKRVHKKSHKKRRTYK